MGASTPNPQHPDVFSPRTRWLPAQTPPIAARPSPAPDMAVQVPTNITEKEGVRRRRSKEKKKQGEEEERKRRARRRTRSEGEGEGGEPEGFRAGT